MTNRCVRIAICLVVAGAVDLPAATAQAQTQGDRGGVSYSFLRATSPQDTNLPLGWLASVDLPFPSGRRGDVAVKPVLEYSGNYRKQQGEAVKVHTSTTQPPYMPRIAITFPLVVGESPSLKTIRVQIGCRFPFYADTL